MIGNTSRTSLQVLARLDALALRSDFLLDRPLLLQDSSQTVLKSYVFEGPHGGGDPIRLGFFAGIHGDEPAGSHALVRLAELLVQNPALAEGYNIHLYPVCNPAGIDAGTRWSASGKDLNREFWRDSAEPEVKLLEGEIQKHLFHGLVSLHSDDTSSGLYGFVRGAVLARSLLEPALAAAEAFLPRNRNTTIDGFPAENGIITECYDGILTSPPKLSNTPFEVIFETPQGAAPEKQVDAFVAGILSILTRYREFISFAADL
jgi:predicted deacylase